MFPDYEFRTTIVPVKRENGETSFMTPKEIKKTARMIEDCTGDDRHKYFLQRFVARSKDEMLDEKFSKENLPKEMQETPDSLMQECLKEARIFLPKTEIRN